VTRGPGVGAAEPVRERIGLLRPEVAIVLGSGLGPFADQFADAVRIPYQDIPGFPAPTVEGHRGELVAGRFAGRTVIAQCGRFHGYEGHDPHVVARAVRLFAELGIDTLVLTNAAGGIRRTLVPGALMLIADHINLSFGNPLSGPVLGGEQRFPDMSCPYDGMLRDRVREAGRRLGIAVEEGVYAGVPGPSYETPAEIRMLERLGADAVGMSTVLEVVAARARGMRCLGISTITNSAAGITGEPLSHADVMRVATRARADLGRLLAAALAR